MQRFALLLLCGASALGAQTIQGDLVDRVSQTPVSGAHVALLDAQGREIARVVTDQTGRFVIQLANPGTYQLRAKRVGFRPHLSPPVVVALGQSVTQRLEIESIAIDLAAVVVEGDRQCNLAAGRAGPAVAALWEELREALSAVAWSAREPGYRFELAVFERDLTAGGRLLRDSTWVLAGHSRNPFQSPDPAALAQDGYVVQDGDGWVFSAPDADVLLSDAFLAAHCFDTRIGRAATAGLLGLGFAPIRGREVPDVAGVLWLNKTTSELRFLEFEYTLLPSAIRDAAAGGHVSFRRAPTGAWIVQDWVIRMPRSGPSGSAARHAGGEVLRIAHPNGTVVYERPLATLDGTVFDSTTGGGLANAVVSLPGTPYSASTDGEGRFHLGVPLVGTRSVTFNHPRLDSLFYSPADVVVDLEATVPHAISLAVPSEAALVARLCLRTRVAAEERVVTGLVRKQSNPLPQATITFTWQVVSRVRGRLYATTKRLTTESDETGRYTACGLPLERPITLNVSDATDAAPTVTMRFAKDGVTVGTATRPVFVGRIWRQDLVVP